MKLDVDPIAKAIFEAAFDRSATPWNNLSRASKARWRRKARAAYKASVGLIFSSIEQHMGMLKEGMR